MDFLIFGCIAYLLGSIPTAVWLGKMKYAIDIREHGSKNAGATNTFRILGKKAGIFVLSVDMSKGLVAVLLPVIFISQNGNNDHLIHVKIVAGIMAVIGHIFPVYARFKGGKGVATSVGILIGIHPPAALSVILIFLIVFIASKYVSLGAVTAALFFPPLLYFVFKENNTILIAFSILLSTTVILLHHKNINRLLHNKESKMNLFKKET